MVDGVGGRSIGKKRTPARKEKMRELERTFFYRNEGERERERRPKRGEGMRGKRREKDIHKETRRMENTAT